LSVEKAGFSIGQKLDVKCLGKNEKGQLRLSRRAVLLRDSPQISTGNSTDLSSNTDQGNRSTIPFYTKSTPIPKVTVSSVAESSY
jgi:predicted RNA-binding protein with RPS1 domain